MLPGATTASTQRAWSKEEHVFCKDKKCKQMKNGDWTVVSYPDWKILCVIPIPDFLLTLPSSIVFIVPHGWIRYSFIKGVVKPFCFIVINNKVYPQSGWLITPNTHQPCTSLKQFWLYYITVVQAVLLQHLTKSISLSFNLTMGGIHYVAHCGASTWLPKFSKEATAGAQSHGRTCK